MKMWRRHSVILLAVAVIAYLFNLLIIQLVRHKITFRDRIVFSDKKGSNHQFLKSINDDIDFSTLRPLAPAQSMQEIDAFSEEAMNWSTIFGLNGSGLAVFDANGDGRIDVYFCQDGQNWARPTDENGVIVDVPRPQRNLLYLNQGNDQNGRPIFEMASTLAASNTTYVREELLVENYLFPRTAVTDSRECPGRRSSVAAAVDINGDGLMDLLVGTGLPGMLWSHAKTQRILPRFIAPTGRSARASRQPLSALGMHLVHHQPRQSLDERQKSSRGSEFVGANSLFINLGDRDGDGVPEWQDVSREAGIEGQRYTTSFAIADIDLDGDLDIYEANVMDSDYWPGGAKGWAGGANQLYINQLADNGTLTFIQRAEAMDVDGVYDEAHPRIPYYKIRRIPWIPIEYSLLFFKVVPFFRDPLEINGVKAEQGQISWASIFQDVNEDGYPDLWVANDMSKLALYLNDRGTGFKRTKHLRSGKTGNWMSFAPADYNGDLHEDLFIGNLGGGIDSGAFIPDPHTMFDPVVVDGLFFTRLVNGYHETRHVFVDGTSVLTALVPQVKHSMILPPDSAIPNNRTKFDIPSDFQLEYDRQGIDPYEFVWGSVSFDIQNDGWEDLYFVGNLFERSGGLVSLMGTGPGRLLVNASRRSDALRFADLTAEHHLFNINELAYDHLDEHGYIYRKAPRQNWAKRDMVYSYDRSVWLTQGRVYKEQVVNQDLLQTCDNGRSVVVADLNQDGYLDMIIRNVGGYDSRRSTARNLKATLNNASVSVLPPHDHSYPTLTEFEPGATRTFINAYGGNHWLKVRLLDEDSGSYNRYGIGARVVVNRKHLRVQRATQGTFLANHHTALSFGLGEEPATHIELTWPDRLRTVQSLDLDHRSMETIFISKQQGVISR